MNPFWNPTEKRLRALWRIVLQIALWSILTPLLALIPLAFLALGLFASGRLQPGMSTTQIIAAVQSAFSGNLLVAALQLLLTMLGMTLSIALAARLLDRRRFSAFGLHLNRQWWLDLGFGLALGAICMTFIFLVERAAGWVTVTGTFDPVQRGLSALLLLGVVRYICVGIQEELFSRGYQLKNLTEGLNIGSLGPRGGILLAYAGTSIFFGLLHHTNPNSTWTSSILIMLAGLFLGLGYVLTGELGISIGLHITWNYFQGYVFGFPVSGGASNVSIIRIQQGGPLAWTGGAFGPEAGYIGVLAILLGSLLTLAYVWYTRGNLSLFRPLAEYTPRLAVDTPPDDTSAAV